MSELVEHTKVRVEVAVFVLQTDHFHRGARVESSFLETKQVVAISHSAFRENNNRTQPFSLFNLEYSVVYRRERL